MIIKKTVYASLLVLIFVMLVSFSNPSNIVQTNSHQQFIQYQDKRFDFSFDYPDNWHIIYRDDSDLSGMGGVMLLTPIDPNTVTTPANPHEAPPYIAIGLYLAELEANQSLSEWAGLYQEASRSFEKNLLQNNPIKTLTINQANAIHQSGISPLTDYQFTNISHGKTVWFIWTNIKDSENEPYAQIYSHMTSSFRFGRNAPKTLFSIYGEDFQPLQLSSQTASNNPLNSTTKYLPKQNNIFALSSSWKSPVVGMYNVQCGSAFHVGIAQWAADVGTPFNTSIYAAYSGNVIFAGWDNTGYGNLIKTSHIGGYIAFYAHLNTIHVSNNANIVTGQFIARSGNSGPSATHLHFHVNNQSLTGMSGFFPNTSPPPAGEVVYPSMTVGSCGDMGR